NVVTTHAPSHEIYVISGPESDHKLTFWTGDYVYLNRGSSKGAKIGDEFLVSRAVNEKMTENEWFPGQLMIEHAMGQTYEDVGRLKIIAVQQNTSVAQVVASCDLMQRDDIVEPFTERPAPAYKAAPAKWDAFAPADGKAKAMIVNTKRFGQVVGKQ